MVSKTLSNKLAYASIVLGFVLLVVIGVDAYGTNNPAVFGHTLDEVDPPIGCQSGEVLLWTASGWDCRNMINANLVASGNDLAFAKYGVNGYLIEPTTTIMNNYAQIGVGGVTSDPNSYYPKLHVFSGNLMATGTICSDESGCIGDLNPKISDEYAIAASNSNSNVLDLSVHELCFLTSHSASGPNLDSTCEIVKDVDPTGPSGFYAWRLYARSNAIGESITCKARCLT